MSLLSYLELKELVEQGVITDIPLDNINAASIDINLGDFILEEWRGQTVWLGEKDHPHQLDMREVDISRTPYILKPGQFILAQSRQTFNLPAYISAEYKLKSSMARIGLEHLNAGWCDAGWNGSVLTLELKNMTNFAEIVLKAGAKIGQMVFFRHAQVPQDRTYAVRGRYNGDTKVTGAKK